MTPAASNGSAELRTIHRIEDSSSGHITTPGRRTVPEFANGANVYANFAAIGASGAVIAECSKGKVGQLNQGETTCQ